MLQAIRNYFREVQTQLQQTSWPSQQTTRSMTLLVIAVAAFLTLYLGGIDFLLQKIMEFLI